MDDDPRELIRELRDALRKQLDFCHSPRTPVEYVDIGHAALRRAEAWLAAPEEPRFVSGDHVLRHYGAITEARRRAEAEFGAAPASEPVGEWPTDLMVRELPGRRP